MKWYRHVVILILGLGVITLALWSLEQAGNGAGMYVVLGVFGMACLTVMLIFGIEMDEIHIEVWDGLLVITIPFSDTSNNGADDGVEE